MVIMVIVVTQGRIIENQEKDVQLKANIRKGLGTLERKKRDEKDSRIAWIGGLYAGIVIILIGIIWLSSIMEWINLPWHALIPILLIFLGIGILIFVIWLRVVIRDDDDWMQDYV